MIVEGCILDNKSLIIRFFLQIQLWYIKGVNQLWAKGIVERHTSPINVLQKNGTADECGIRSGSVRNIWGEETIPSNNWNFQLEVKE